MELYSKVLPSFLLLAHAIHPPHLFVLKSRQNNYLFWIIINRRRAHEALCYDDKYLASSKNVPPCVKIRNL